LSDGLLCHFKWSVDLHRAVLMGAAPATLSQVALWKIASLFMYHSLGKGDRLS
jgi:hypothetical protein